MPDQSNKGNTEGISDFHSTSKEQQGSTARKNERTPINNEEPWHLNKEMQHILAEMKNVREQIWTDVTRLAKPTDETRDSQDVTRLAKLKEGTLKKIQEENNK